jgi:hypothetical protein
MGTADAVRAAQQGCPSMLPQRIWASSREAWSRAAEQRERRPVIIANPPTDREFRDLIQSALLTGRSLPGDLEAMLRTRYPEAVVRRRDLDAEGVEVWYVYRDGHWIRSGRDAGS